MASPPLVLTPVPKADIRRGDGELVCEFLESFCRVTKSGVAAKAGELIRLRPWQRNVIGMTYARTTDKRLRHRTALIGLPRKNGKSAIASGLGLYGLLMQGEGAEVYSCAGSLDQARIVFGVAKRMVEMSSELSEVITPYQKTLEVKATGSIYKVLSSDAPLQEGLNPSLVIFDELHTQPDYELYNVMNLAFGARIDPLLIAITTAGVKTGRDGQDSVCYWLYQYIEKIAKGEIDDSTTFGAWFGASQDEPYDAPKTWANGNPGYGDLLDPADFASTVKKTPENEFRTKRLNQWRSAAVAWLPQGAWEARKTDDTSKGDPVVLGFDGSRSGDVATLLRASVHSNPRVEVVGLWEKPTGLHEDEDWQVPREEVKEAIRQECRDNQVLEIAWQEFLWPQDAEQLTDEGLPVVVFGQTLTRMGPATQRMFELVMAKDGSQLTHDGNPALTRHVGNAQAKTDSRGTRLVRTNNSLMAIAAVMAVDRAGYWLTAEDRPGYFKGTPIDELRFVW